MTALELLERMEWNPDEPWVDREMDRLSGIATPGDVDPILAGQFVIGRLLVKALTGGGDEPSVEQALNYRRKDAGRRSTPWNGTTSPGSQS